jgi:serine/threonine-protein kinase
MTDDRTRKSSPEESPSFEPAATRDPVPETEPAPLAEAAPSPGSTERTPVGRYRLIRPLGTGGMGTVFEAEHVDLGKRVAVKMLHPPLAADADVRARFLREGQAAARIRHPNVVDVYDVGIDAEQPYLVMELLDGESLGAAYAREAPLPAERLADLVVPVVAGLTAAHALGVVHRDLKPQNVFLANAPGGIIPKVVDFGISKLVDAETAQSLTGTSALLGTPYYMSPEQATNAKAIHASSDQYSLGVILYEGVTGRRPYQADTLYALLNAIVRGVYPPVSSLVRGVPRELEQCVARAMAKDPQDRFPNVRELGLELMRFASPRTRVLYTSELSSPIAGQPAPLRLPAAEGVLGTSSGTLASANNELAVPHRRRGLWGRVGVAATVALAAALAIFVGLPRAERAELPPASSLMATAPSAQESAAKLVRSSPAGALVLVGERAVGTTPCHVVVPPGEAGLELHVSLGGYRTLTRRLHVWDPDTLDLVLESLDPRPSLPATASTGASRQRPPSVRGRPKPDLPKLAPR